MVLHTIVDRSAESETLIKILFFYFIVLLGHWVKVSVMHKQSSIKKNVKIIVGQNEDISNNLLIISYWLRFDNATPHLPSMKMEHLTDADTILRMKRAYKGSKRHGRLHERGRTA